MEVTDDGGWHAGAEVRIVGLVKTPQHNGKVGIISAKAPGTEGRVGVELGKGKPIALRRENLELVKAPLDIARALTIPTSEPSRWRPFVAAASVSCAPLPILFSVRAAVALSRGAWRAATLTCCIACIATWRSVRGRERPPGWWSKTLPLAFAASVAWISLLATELLEALTALGVVSGVSPAVLGVTVLAWGNSVGDLVSDVVVARGGAPEMAVAACHSSPLFNLCVGLGLAFCASHWRADFRRVLYTGSHTTTSAW